MIELIAGLPDNTVAFEASGQVTGDDYQNVVIPAVEAKFARHDQLRLLYHIGPEFKKFTTTALWDDARVGLYHLAGFERVALVTDVGWVQAMGTQIARLAPATVRVFTNAELDQAKAWISA